MLVQVYGFGYCVLTDWHWQVKRARGIEPDTGSFIKWAIDESTGWDSPGMWVDRATIGVFAVICVVTPALWWWERRRVAQPGNPLRSPDCVVIRSWVPGHSTTSHEHVRETHDLGDAL